MDDKTRSICYNTSVWAYFESCCYAGSIMNHFNQNTILWKWRIELIEPTEYDLQKLENEESLEDNQSNEELCELIINGDIDAQAVLCEQNKGLIYKIANKYDGSLGGVLFIDDLYQVGLLGMIAAAK